MLTGNAAPKKGPTVVMYRQTFSDSEEPMNIDAAVSKVTIYRPDWGEGDLEIVEGRSNFTEDALFSLCGLLIEMGVVRPIDLLRSLGGGWEAVEVGVEQC